jgi:ribosomal protein L7Ae-like RNA K-turn-binding protein
LNIEKVNSLIRLARKGRMIEIGKTAVEILLKRKRAYLVIIAADVSDKLRRQMEIECSRQNVPVYIFSVKSELGKLCGRDEVGVIAVSDKNLAEGIRKELLIN